jgi:IS1 family transposase
MIEDLKISIGRKWRQFIHTCIVGIELKTKPHYFGGRFANVNRLKVPNLASRMLQYRSYVNPRAFGIYDGLSIEQCCPGTPFGSYRGNNIGLGLPLYGYNGADSDDNTHNPYDSQDSVCHIFWSKHNTEIRLRVIIGPISLFLGCLLLYYGASARRRGWRWCGCGFGSVLIGVGMECFGLPLYYGAYRQEPQYCRDVPHNGKSVTQKYLTTCYLCNTVIGMANVLPKDKQVAVIGALAEGSSIRSIERMTGIHRDTIMRLGVHIGQNCELLLDSKMQDLGCRYLQFDEVWGFIGKKERHVRVADNPEFGDVWTFCAIDSETKLVPSFLCGKRTRDNATAFVQDVAGRLRNQVQLSTDALHGYVEAVERAFGTEVDYGQIVKVYTHDDSQHPERKYSAPHFASAIRRPIVGNPDMELVSTSHVERLNATTRLHVKRLSRLTLAFSKKLENFKAAVALHFAYYNFVKRHNTLRMTPAMAAGIERDFWTVEQLVEAVS